MSELHLDQDEVVYTDTDGLAFTRADYPAADYTVDSTVCLIEHPGVQGIVVGAGSAAVPPPGVDPSEWVPVRWHNKPPGLKHSSSFWVPVDVLSLVN